MAMKKTATVLACIALVMSLATLGGCADGGSGSAGTVQTPEGASPLMPASHAGRFDDLGANGCYGCHGANDMANPMLKDAVVMPEDHYAQGMYATQKTDPVRDQCITCHPQG